VPLAFESQSHGRVAFGFFNIDSDMLLLEQRFFFADHFCESVIDLARGGVGTVVSIDGWRIRRADALGNLHGAIAGVDLSGFIGASYREFPFPARTEDFKQSPDGARSQPWMTEAVARFGEAERIPLAWRAKDSAVSVAEYDFDRSGFRRLVEYVERGGYPRYRDERRPECVTRMMAALGELSAPWL